MPNVDTTIADPVAHDTDTTWLLGRHYPRMVAIEFTSRFIYLAACQATLRQRAIKIAGRKPLDSVLLENPSELGNCVGEWLHALEIPPRIPVACVIPSTLLEYDSVQEVPEDVDLASFSASCFREMLGDDWQHFASGRWYTRDASGHSALHFVWTPNRFAFGLVDGLSKMGFECVGLEAPATVLARMPGNGEQHSSDGYRLVVSIDGSHATMVLARAGIAHYVRHHQSVANQPPTTLVAKSMAIGDDSAETLLEQWGIVCSQSPSASVLPEMLEKAIRPWLAGLVFELERTLRFIRHRNQSIHVLDIVLCGPESAIPGLCESVQQHVDVPVSCDAPRNCRWLSAQAYTPALAIAAAMVIRE